MQHRLVFTYFAYFNSAMDKLWHIQANYPQSSSPFNTYIDKRKHAESTRTTEIKYTIYRHMEKMYNLQKQKIIHNTQTHMQEVDYQTLVCPAQSATSHKFNKTPGRHLEATHAHLHTHTHTYNHVDAIYMISHCASTITEAKYGAVWFLNGKLGQQTITKWNRK